MVVFQSLNLVLHLRQKQNGTFLLQINAYDRYAQHKDQEQFRSDSMWHDRSRY